MILAVPVPDKRELVICAAATVREQKEFLTRIEREKPDLIQATDENRFFLDNDLANFKVEPTILEFPDADSMKAFIDENEIETTNFPNAHGRQRRMLELEEFNSDTGGQTLAEIHGLTEDDPWDTRTEEQKAAAKAKAQDKSKGGDVTGDSWGGGKGGDKSKGEGATDEATPQQPAEEESDEEVVINPDGSVSIVPREKSVTDARPQRNDPNATGGATGGDDPEADREGGLRIRDMKITVDDDGNIIIGDILADKDLFSPDTFHLTVKDANGEPNNDDAIYKALMKRCGLIGNGRYQDATYKTHENGGIVVELGGASTLRMNEALAEAGHDYTMIPLIEEQEGYGEDNVFKIANDELVSTYFRMDALDRQIAAVNQLLVNAQGGKLPYRARDLEDGGSWHAYIRRADCERAVEILVEAGAKAELVEVDHLGQRIVEEGVEGVEVVDTGAAFVEPPAPWNEQRDAFYALTEDEQKKAMHKLLPFLLYTMRDYGYPTRIIVHITPKTYFNTNGKLWDGELPLEGILPDNFEKFGDKAGVYQVKSLDMNTADFLLGNKAGMKESLNLRAHLNGLGDKAV